MNLIKTNVNQKVFCTLQVEGLHNWPDCYITEVDYLKFPHRHLFCIKAVCDVSHDNRNIEFIELKHKIVQFLKEKYFDSKHNLHLFGHRSCEMIARELMDQFNLTEVVVDEDGENGCILTKTHEAV